MAYLGCRHSLEFAGGEDNCVGWSPYEHNVDDVWDVITSKFCSTKQTAGDVKAKKLVEVVLVSVKQ